MFGVLVAVTFLAFSATNVIGDPLFNVVGFMPLSTATPS